MTTKRVRHSHPVDEEGNIIPLPDPPRIIDAMQQFPHIADANTILGAHFRRLGRNDVLVGGEGYLCATARVRSNLSVPDCLVAFNVDPEAILQRNGYVIDEVGKPPDLTLEVASDSTGRVDYLVKPGRYASLGVTEYWRFDSTGGKRHDKPLGGDRLVDGEYQPIPLTVEADGVIWGHSRVLDLDVCWVQGNLRFYDPAAREFLPDMYEAISQRDDALASLAEAKARAVAAEAEVRRLRDQLAGEQ